MTQPWDSPGRIRNLEHSTRREIPAAEFASSNWYNATSSDDPDDCHVWIKVEDGFRPLAVGELSPAINEKQSLDDRIVDADVALRLGLDDRIRDFAGCVANMYEAIIAELRVDNERLRKEIQALRELPR